MKSSEGGFLCRGAEWCFFSVVSFVGYFLWFEFFAVVLVSTLVLEVLAGDRLLLSIYVAKMVRQIHSLVGLHGYVFLEPSCSSIKANCVICL